MEKEGRPGAGPHRSEWSDLRAVAVTVVLQYQQGISSRTPINTKITQMLESLILKDVVFEFNLRASSHIFLVIARLCIIPY